MKRIILLLLPLLMTACSALPAEERAFAVVLAVSRTGEVWQAAARIPTYQTGGGYADVSGEGRSLSAALANLDASAPMHLHLSQIRLLVLSAELSHADVSAILQVLSGESDMRMDAAVALTRTQQEALMSALKPSTGSRLSKSMDVLLESRHEQGVIPGTTIADALRLGDRETPVFANLTVTEDGIDLSGGWALSFAGAAEELTAQEMQLLSLMQSHERPIQLSLPEGEAVLHDASARVYLGTDAEMTMTLRATRSSLTADGLEAILAKRCQQLLSRLYSAGCDVLAVGRKVVMQTKKMSQWHDMAWPDACRSLRWTVRVGINVPK